MKKKIIIITIVLLIIAMIILAVLNYLNLIPKKYYTAEDFGIETIKSPNDYDNDGIDDYTDIMLGARQDAENMPTYKSAYYAGGYPPEDEGVCTDLVWRAFKNAGYSLKDLVDYDIANNLKVYTQISTPDPNIDFRRVYNLKVFFERNAEALTKDINQIEEWQPGDIVTFNESHIGIISDKRNSKGIPYLIHNTAQPVREEDVMERYANQISGHFRWNGL